MNNILNVYLHYGGDQNSLSLIIKERNNKKKVYGVLTYGGKENMLDAAEILFQIWEGNKKYSHTQTIIHFWDKSAPVYS